MTNNSEVWNLNVIGVRERERAGLSDDMRAFVLRRTIAIMEPLPILPLFLTPLTCLVGNVRKLFFRAPNRAAGLNRSRRYYTGKTTRETPSSSSSARVFQHFYERERVSCFNCKMFRQ